MPIGTSVEEMAGSFDRPGLPTGGLRAGIVALAVLALLVTTAAVASADYLQAGADAARTGTTTDVGPERDDVAFRVELPGIRPGVAEPLVVDGDVYAAVQSVDAEGLDTDGLVRVDLATAETEVLVETETAPMTMAADGTKLYVTRDRGVDAYPLSGGEPAWSYEHPELTNLPHNRTWCASPAVSGSTVFVLCSETSVEDPVPTYPETPTGSYGPAPSGQAETVVFVAALDAATGEARWVWSSDEADEAPGPATHQPGAGPGEAPGRVGGITVVGDQVYTMSQDASGAASTESVYLRSFRRTDGGLMWTHTVAPSDRAPEDTDDGDPAFVEGTRVARLLNTPTGTSGEVYFVVRNLFAVDADSGEEAWRHPLPQVEQEIQGGSGFALSGEQLYVSSRSVLFKFDRPGQSLTWERVIGAGEHFDDSPMILAGDLLYARAHLDETDFLYAFNPEDGNVVFKHQLVKERDISPGTLPNHFNLAVAEGVAVLQGVDGTLRVIGHTPASLQPAADVSEDYPDVGEQVHVNLSGTEPGVDGPAERFRAVWGDGTVTEWQEDPVVTHAYGEGGDKQAVFEVRNSAGQTASTTQTFHVGQTEPNLFTTAFQPEHQDLTFGVLGLAVALCGGAFGIVRRRRRRRRLERELDAVEAIFEESRDEPLVCAGVFADRLATARGLVTDGKLDEAQFQVLRDRIRVLTDRLLEDETLTEEERARLRERVELWSPGGPA